MGFIFMKPKGRHYKVRKSAESQAVLDRLRGFLEGALDEPVRFLLRFWGDQRTVLTYAELRRIITDEDVPQDIMDDWFHDYSTLLSERITPMWRDAMVAGYRSNPAFEGRGFQFNSSEENVRRWMADRSAELVTNCCREQREAIRYLVAESVNHQMAPAELARYIRPTIGLTERQAAANLKYYENMKAQLSEDHPRMKPEAIERRAREASARYAERQQRYRAETIARTELATAYHQGNDEAVRQAMAQDKMPQMKKVWSTSGDDKVCPACSALEGMEIGMDGDFKFTSGRRTMEVELPPAHPRCACAVMYVEEKQQESSEEQHTDNFESYQEDGDNQQLEELDYYRHRYQESEGIYETYNNGSNDVIKPRNIRKNMQKSDVGREMLEYLEENNIPVKLLYGIDNPNDDYGYYDPIDDVIRIFVDKTVTIEKTVEIIIHEAAHRKYDIGDDQWSEAVCIAQEVKHRMRRNTLTSQEKRSIIKLSKELYPEFPWRRV